MKKYIAIFFAFCSSTLLFGQGGSNYSIFGIGDVYQINGAAYEGLAGTSTAIENEHAINLKNPALWSYIKSTRLQAGFRFNHHTNVRDNFNNAQTNSKVDGVLSIFNIDTSLGFSVSLGFYPYSSINYMIANPIKVTIDSSEIHGETNYTGQGGLSIAYIGGAIKPFNKLSLGASIYAILGSSQQLIQTNIFQTNTFQSADKKNDNYLGFGIKGGIYFKPFDNFSLGAYFENNQFVNVNRTTIFSSYLLGDTSYTSSFEMNLPNAYGIGIAYRTGKFLIGVDYSYQDFNNFCYQNSPNVKFKNLSSYSIGLSRIGSKLAGAEFADKISYNFGFGYKQLYYNVQGIDINEIFASIGVEVPLIGGSIIDAAYSLGIRGTTENSLIKEFFGRLTIDISIGEIWFKPFSVDY